jgi:hypothetical protein
MSGFNSYKTAIDLTLGALDRMIDSVGHDMREQDPGNHATIGVLKGEEKGLLAARIYLQAALAKAGVEPESRPAIHKGRLTDASGWQDTSPQEYVAAADYEALRQRFEMAVRKPTYETMDAARNEWWSTLSSRGNPARLTNSLGAFSDGFFDGWKAAFLMNAAPQPNTAERLPASPVEDDDQRRAQPLSPDSSVAAAASRLVPVELPREVAARLAEGIGYWAEPCEPQYEEGVMVEHGMSEADAKSICEDGITDQMEHWKQTLALLDATSNTERKS